MAGCSACRTDLYRSLLRTFPLSRSFQGAPVSERTSLLGGPLRSPTTRSASTSTPAVNSANAAKYKRADRATSSKKKRKGAEFYKTPDLSIVERFSLCDAMRYIRAFEVGQDPKSPKYTLFVRVKSLKNGPVIRNIFRLPHPLATRNRIAVICPPDSKAAQEALANGASLVGEDEIIDAVKQGTIAFERCLAHPDSLPKLNKSGLGRILGPKGLMPSPKNGTVTRDIAARLNDMQGAIEYRERTGVVRLVVGQLGFTPDQMQANLSAVMALIKKDIGELSDKINKEISEVVLASTHSPGFSLNGEFRTADSLSTADLSVD